MKKFLSALLVINLVLTMLLLTSCTIIIGSDPNDTEPKPTPTEPNPDEPTDDNPVTPDPDPTPEDPTPDPTPDEPESKVSLKALSVSTENPVATNQIALMSFLPMNMQIPIDAQPFANAGISIIYKTEDTIYLTIDLNNTEDYYIMDFKLHCDEEDLTITTRSNSRHVEAGTKMTFRWDEAISTNGNQSATFEVKLSDTNVSPDKIIISDMYYSDKGDGSNRVAVDLNNQEVMTVHKVETLLHFTEKANTPSALVFKLDASDICTITGVYSNDVAVEADADGRYHCDGGKLRIDYDVTLTNGEVYHAAYMEDVELVKLTWNSEEKIEVLDQLVTLHVTISGPAGDTWIHAMNSKCILNAIITESCIEIMYYNVNAADVVDYTTIMFAGKVYTLAEFLEL